MARSPKTGSLPGAGTAIAREHERRADVWHEQDTRDAAAIREQDLRFQAHMRSCAERGLFPGQSAPVLVLRG